MTTPETRPRKLSEWRGIQAIGNAFKSMRGQPETQRSPFEEGGPVNFKLTHNTRKRQFTGELKASDVANYFKRSKIGYLVRAGIGLFVLADLALLFYLFF